MTIETKQNEIIKIIDGEMQNPKGWCMNDILAKLESLNYTTDFARSYILRHCGYHKDKNGNEVKLEESI